MTTPSQAGDPSALGSFSPSKKAKIHSHPESLVHQTLHQFGFVSRNSDRTSHAVRYFIACASTRCQFLSLSLPVPNPLVQNVLHKIGPVSQNQRSAGIAAKTKSEKSPNLSPLPGAAHICIMEIYDHI
jgi:hypothetical protein